MSTPTSSTAHTTSIAMNTMAANALPIGVTPVSGAENGFETLTNASPIESMPQVDMRLAACGGATPPGWRVAWAQIIGTRHPRLTEDSVAHRSHLQTGQVLGSAQALYVAVADGVGGGARGEIASAALVAHSIELPDPLLGEPEAMAQWMALAEGQVQMKLREVSYSPGAATLAAAWLWPHAEANGDERQGCLMRVGDARLCRFNGQHVTALTADQTYAQVGETPPEGAGLDDPARMVGTGFMGPPELIPFTLAPGHTLLLCSDGLHQGLSAERMAELMRECAGQGDDLSEIALHLAQAARLAGSEDDITVLLAQADDACHAATPLKPWRELFKRVFA